jgi:hypothetical protein
MENNTNTYIANINLNRDRFNNMLTSLGGLPSSKNITPPDSPTDTLVNPADLLPPLMPNYDELTGKEPQDWGRTTVRINKTPTSAPLNVLPIDKQGS